MGIMYVRDPETKEFLPIPAIMGAPGKDGKSPYQVAQENGYQGTEEEFNQGLLNVGKDFGNTISKIITNVTITTDMWTPDETFESYPFKADISCEGVTATDWICTLLTPDHTNRDLDNFFGPYSFVDDNKVVIFGKESKEVTLENLLLQRVVM